MVNLNDGKNLNCPANLAAKMDGEEESANNPNTDLIFDENIFVYPNPTAGDINIRFNALPETDYSFRIYDVIGRIIYDNKEKYVAGENTKLIRLIDVSGGAYFMHVEKNGEEVKTIKLIVQ